MKQLLVIAFLFFSSIKIYAHPGIGIVADSKGNIYYTDLKQIWKIDLQGKKHVVVSGVHSHEIFIDADDNLFGEHLWYNGEKADTWGHYAWRLSANGKLDTMVGPAAGFLSDYSFKRDGAGNMYWIQQWKPKSRIMVKSPGAEPRIMAEKEMGSVGWMHVTTGGTVFFSDRKSIYRMEKGGQVKTVADHPGTVSLAKPMAAARQETLMWGLWTDKNDQIYCADMNGRKVIRIDEQGEIHTVAYSAGAWSPLSGVFDGSGNLWLLEGNTLNEVRVRKISSQQLSMGPAGEKVSNAETFFYILFYSLAFITIVILSYFLFRKLRRRNVNLLVTI